LRWLALGRVTSRPSASAPAGDGPLRGPVPGHEPAVTHHLAGRTRPSRQRRRSAPEPARVGLDSLTTVRDEVALRVAGRWVLPRRRGEPDALPNPRQRHRYMPNRAPVARGAMQGSYHRLALPGTERTSAMPLAGNETCRKLAATDSRLRGRKASLTGHRPADSVSSYRGASVLVRQRCAAALFQG
jgi:hypothetical protein